MRPDPNLALLTSIAVRLGALREEMVFLGGCATGLLITDPAAPGIRPTSDVDVVVELVSRAAWYELSVRLRAQGFQEDSEEGAPICRWVVDGLKLDVMPTDPAILGFSNRWYPLALQQAIICELPGGVVIRHVSAPCFMATKLEAFRGRGKGDYLLSHDIEDMIAVLDGRPSLVNEIVAAPQALRAALGAEARFLLANRDFLEALPGHLPPDAASQGRAMAIRARLASIAEWTS